MKVTLSLCLVVAASTACFAQFDPPGVTKADKAYHAYRLVDSNPPYSLAKVESLVKHIKAVDVANSDMQTAALKQFSSLSVSEKFTYCMLHGEVMTQNCDGMPAFVGEQSKIFAHVPSLFSGEESWSDRQTAFLAKNRSKVIALLRATIKSTHRVGLNLKHAVLQLDAYEMIPDLVAAYNTTKKDNDILTLLMQLMVDGKDKTFLASESYKKLYADEDSSYKSFLNANSANKALIIQRATNFYKSRKA